MLHTETNLADRASKIRWFHTMDLGSGLVTDGGRPLDIMQRKAETVFRLDVTDCSVIDIGAWDGFFSFEAKRRGARRVLATDHYCWSGPGWGSNAGFRLAREVLNLDVEELDIDVMDLSPQSVGFFDVALFLGVFYHLRHPLLALERIAEITKDVLVVETYTAKLPIDKPAMVFYPGAELDNTTSNWWGPNEKCVIAMLQTVGFKHVAHVNPPGLRGFFFAAREENLLPDLDSLAAAGVTED